MCIWQEIKNTNDCTDCPLFNDDYISNCDEFEDIQDIINIIGLLEKMLDLLE